MSKFRIVIGLLPALMFSAFALAQDVRVDVPDGFVVERVATEPAVRFPMFACFDDRGRLFVAESSGLDLYDELQKQTRNCRVSMLQDRDGDGRFETANVFADKLVFPMGLVWRDGTLYVADPPDLITLTDGDNDGLADQRKVILSGFGHQDNGSLHGLVFGPDGLLYMTMGNPDGYKLKAADGSVLSGTSGALLRCRPDGTHPEVICRGFENLVEIAWLPSGEVIGTDNWYQKPTGGVRDALVHLVEGGLYPLHSQDLGTTHVITGDPLPPLATFPAVALSGLMRYEGNQLPPEMRGNLFAAQHNTRKVTRHRLERVGATFRSIDADFVTSAHPDFHPSDVLEDADGSVLVIDTGGWYVQHCPTGKIRDSRAAGGIYRVRSNAAKALDPWGLEVAWDTLETASLAKLLLDPRPAVRQKAERAMVRLGDDAIDHLRPLLLHNNEATQSHAAWALAAIGGDSSLEPMRRVVADDPNHPVVLRALAHRADKRAGPALTHWIGRCDEPAVRLALAEALMRCGTVDSVPPILAALAGEKDRFIEHALIVALHRLADRRQLVAALQDGNARVQKAALLLLDQPPHQSVTASQLVSRLSADDAALRKTAQSILAKHPEWVNDALGFFRVSLDNPKLSPEDQRALADTILAFATRQEVVDWLGEALADAAKSANPSKGIIVLQTMARIGRPKEATRWIAALRAVIDDPALRVDAVRTVATLQMPELDEQLLNLSAKGSSPPTLRIEALRCVIERHPDIVSSAFELLVSQFESGAAAPLRLAAVEVLTKANLTDEQFVRLLLAVANDSLASLDTLYPLLVRSAKPATAAALTDYVARAIKKGWRPDEQKLAALLASLRDSHAQVADRLLAHVRQEKEGVGERLVSLEPLLAGGDQGRGRVIFFDKRVACATCHRVGETGGSIGPDLTKIGAIRSSRDILESVVFPASTIAQGYENYVLAIKGGQELTGIVSERSADGVTLRDSSGAERRLKAEQIVKMRPDRTSVMPEGLDSALTPEEFRDLLAFLQSLK